MNVQTQGWWAPNKGKTDRTDEDGRQWFLHARTTPVWSIRLDDQALRSYVHSPCLLFCPLYCCAWGATELMVLIHLPDAASPSGRRSLLGSDLMDDLSRSSSTMCDPRDSEGIIRSRCCHTCRLYTNVKGIQKRKQLGLPLRNIGFPAIFHLNKSFFGWHVAQLFLFFSICSWGYDYKIIVGYIDLIFLLLFFYSSAAADLGSLWFLLV